MPRKNLFRTSDFAYHITARSNNREWFYIPTPLAWIIFNEKLYLCCEKYDLDLHAFVLMNNHFHLIATTSKQNIDMAMRYFLTEVCRSIQRTTGRINHVFGGRYKWSVLDSSWALAYCLKYVFRNPVRANLVDKVQSYPYSSLIRGQDLPLVEGLGPYWNLVPRGLENQLNWLNQPTLKEHEQLIQSALRRYHFQFSKGANSRMLLRELHKGYGVIPANDHALATF